MGETDSRTQQLGTMPVGRLLYQYALPAIIAMTASSLYNMVDSIFIGQGIGALAMSGLAVTFPLMNLSTAFGTLVGVGAASLTSILLGQRNYRVAQRVLGNVLTMNIAIGVIFSAVSLVFLDPILTFFGASENTLPYAMEYMTVLLIGNIFTHLYFGLNSMLRVAGHPRRAMAATILTVSLNTVLDPIFIFVLDMGIRGAACATVLAQVVSLIWQLRIFSNREELLHFGSPALTFDRRIASRSLTIGMAPFLMNVASCFVVLFINQRLRQYGGDLAIGAYGIVNRLMFLFVMIVMGFTQGMQPIAGYNFGAGQYDRVRKVLGYTVVCAVSVMAVALCVSQLAPRAAVRIFTHEEEMVSIAADGLRLVMMFAPLAGAQMVISNFFQSIGYVGRAIFMSLSRQLLFLLPCLVFLPGIFGTMGVWYSLPASDVISFAVSVFLLLGVLRRLRTGRVRQRTM